MSDSKISELTAHTALIDADVAPVVDSTAGATKKTTWANIKSVLKTYFDGLYSTAVKASGAELDTATDDAKFATAKAIKDAHNVPSVAPSTSGNVLTSDGTDWTSAAPAGGSSTEVITLIDPQINVSSVGDTYTDTTGNTYAETTNQTRLTMTAVRIRSVRRGVSGHVSAGTGTFQLYNFTDGASLAETTTTSTSQAEIATLGSEAATNNGDAITIRVKNSSAGATVTIDAGGMAEYDSMIFFSQRTGDTGNAAWSSGIKNGWPSSIKLALLKRFSSATLTAQLYYQGASTATNENIGSSFGTADANTVWTINLTTKFVDYSLYYVNKSAIASTWDLYYSASVYRDNI